MLGHDRRSNDGRQRWLVEVRMMAMTLLLLLLLLAVLMMNYRPRRDDGNTDCMKYCTR